MPLVRGSFRSSSNHSTLIPRWYPIVLAHHYQRQTPVQSLRINWRIRRHAHCRPPRSWSFFTASKVNPPAPPTRRHPQAATVSQTVSTSIGSRSVSAYKHDHFRNRAAVKGYGNGYGNRQAMNGYCSRTASVSFLAERKLTERSPIGGCPSLWFRRRAAGTRPELRSRRPSRCARRSGRHS